MVALVFHKQNLFYSILTPKSLIKPKGHFQEIVPRDLKFQSFPVL